MKQTSRALAARLGRVVVGAALAAALTGCNQPPALTKAELDTGKLSKKHPKVAPDVASNCRACHREQPPIRK